MRVSGRYITTRGYICPGTIIYILLLTALRLYDSYYSEELAVMSLSAPVRITPMLPSGYL